MFKSKTNSQLQPQKKTNIEIISDIVFVVLAVVWCGWFLSDLKVL